MMSTATINTLIIFGLFAAFIILTLLFNKGRQLKITFTIDAGGEKRIEILASRRWNEVEVRVDGTQACIISKKELLSGYDLRLSDGSILNIKRPRFFLDMRRLLITKNGLPLAPSLTGYDNQMAVTNAAYLIYIVAMVNLILGILSIFVKIEAFTEFNFGWLNVVYGLVFMVLGFFAQRKSVEAMILFIIIFGLDSFSFLLLSFQTGLYIIILIFLGRLVFLAPAFLALGEIFRRRTKTVSVLFNLAGAVLMIVAMVGMCGMLTWSISNLVTSWKDLTSRYPNILPHPTALSSTLPAKSTVETGSSCYLKIIDTAEFVNMRDRADNSSGKVVDYLEKNDMAVVLGSDNGSPGNEWWYVEVEHKGITRQGWVIGKWVKFENSRNCSQVQQIATPYP
jgi:hypothetical protein